MGKKNVEKWIIWCGTFDSRHYNAIIGDNSSGSTDRAGIMAE